MLWSFTGFHKGFPKFHRVLLGFYLVLLVLVGLTEFSWVSLGIFLVEPGITGFYLVLWGFTRIITGFYWVSLGFTGFRGLLPGFTGFYCFFFSCIFMDVDDTLWVNVRTRRSETRQITKKTPYPRKTRYKKKLSTATTEGRKCFVKKTQKKTTNKQQDRHWVKTG